MLGTKKNKSVEVAKPTFQERLSGVKSMFKRAHEDASKLNVEMQNEIQSRKNMITSLEGQITTISAVQSETQEFMSNLEKFI